MRSTASSARPSNRATRHPKFVARLTLIMALDGSARFRRALHRALSVSLVVILLTVQAPAAPQVISGMAAQWRAGAALWLSSSGLGERLGALLTGAQRPSPGAQAAQSQRDARVARVQISPGDVTVKEGDQVEFAARAFDAKDAPVGGVGIKWRAYDVARNRPLRMRDGRFVARREGTFTIFARAARLESSVTVRVLADPARRAPRGAPDLERHVSSRDDPPNLSSRREKSPARRRAAAESAPGPSKFVKASFGRKPAAAPPAPSVFLDPDAGWREDNGNRADDPDNRVGDPPGTPADDGAGSGNFQISVPVLGLAGRGQNLALGLSYNSLLWSKTGTSEVTYDADRGWPAPGWALGFGKIIGLNTQGSLLLEPDGTRRSFSGNLTVYGSYTSFNGKTADGSFIDYSTSSYQGVINWAQARYPDGTIIDYGAPANGAVFPVRITDASGNYVSVTYRYNRGPDIDTIIDTAGRAISFYYDATGYGLLTAITAPDLGGGTRTLVRLQYQQADLDASSNYGFAAGTMTRVRDANPMVLRAVYFPGTSTGYWFGDPDSYSSYGMLAKVVEQRAMAFSGPPPVPPSQGPTGQGDITPGTTSQQLSYNYPMSPGALADAPTYTTATLSWANMDAGDSVTNYFVQKNAVNPSEPGTPSSKTEITLPNGTKSVQYSYATPGTFKDGLIYEDDTFDGAGNLLGTSKVTWEQGDYASPRPLHVEATDERGQTLRTEFSYGATYNQTTEVRAFDYDGVTLLRRTATSYQNSANYTSRHILNLPLAVEVYGGDGARASRTEYEYDNAALADAPGVVSHDPAYDPYNTDVYETGECCRWEQGPYGEQYCAEYCTAPVFNPATNYRGLVTRVTSYSDAAPEPAAGTVAETRAYDITGNLVAASASCCEQTTVGYTLNTQYAYPESQTRGSSDPNSPLRVTTGATHDFNTGLGLTATDANGRTTQTTYYQASLRPQDTIMPTGARTSFVYDDAQMKVTETATLADGGVAAQSVTYLNGLGRTRRVEALGTNVWDVVETKYDQLGRVWKQSRPYRSGSEQPQWSETFYDAQGRVWKTLAPDGSANLTFYNEASRPDAATPGSPAGQTRRVVDAWGRERWGRADAQGRLVEVVEPNPSGDGTVAAGGLLTTYAYDTLGGLVQVNQGAQQRRFRYDSLGRLVRQKLAETLATLDDSGQYVGAGGPGAQWSDAFAYDTRSNLTSRTDARGVVVSFAYNNDPLDRLQSVSYAVGAQHDTSSPIAPAATVFYEYMSSGDLTRPWKVTTENVRQDWFSYDAEGRLHDLTMVVLSRTGQPMSTTYDYDTLDRVTEVTYPAQYQMGVTNPPRKVVHHDYDAASRLSGLKVNGTSYASDLVYNASSQVKFLHVGPVGINQITELYNYDAATGLLSDQQVMRDGFNPLLSLYYDYLRPGTTAGRTGQLTRVSDTLHPQHGRTYSYDALGRLKQAAGGDPGAAPLWTQVYGYDRYGNRESVTATGHTASLSAPKDPAARQQRVEVAANSAPPLPEFLREATRRAASDAPEGPGLFGLAPKYAPAAAALLDTPTNLQVTSSGDTQISLGWSSSTGTNFRVERSPGLAGSYTLVGTSSATSINDNSVSRGNAYLYRVCAADAAGQCVSGFSNVALGTAVTFADPTLTAQVTPVRAQHLSDLRLAVNAVRRAANLGDATWTDPTLVPQQTPVRAAHVQELRDRLNEALAALNITVSPFTDPVLATGAGGTLIRKVHVEELRARASRGQRNSSGGGPVPVDGHASLSYDAASNRVNSPGWQYDAAGNQTRALSPGGAWQRMEYDAANRLVAVKTDAGALVAAYTYADTNERLISYEGGARTYYAWGGGGVIAEYTEVDGTASAASPQWSKSYVYLGERLLATQQPNGAGGEYVEYDHPDRLGTRIVTNNVDGSFYEQAALPFGTALDGESTGVTTRRFTSYDRSLATGLDYAVNRHYDSMQGRFTQIDPLEMQATDLSDPQSLNLYTYCGNDPVNNLDQSGLFWGKLFRFLKKALKIIAVAITVAVAVLTIIYAPYLFTTTLKAVLGIITAVANAAQSVLSALGLKTAAGIFGIISAAASFGTSLAALYAPVTEKGGMTWKNIFKAIADGATLASRTLSQLGHKIVAQVFDLVSSAAGFISSSLKDIKNNATGKTTRRFAPSAWEVYKFARGTAEKIANLAGATKVGGYLNVLGIVDDAYDFYHALTKKELEKDEAVPDKIEKLDILHDRRRTLSGLDELMAWAAIVSRKRAIRIGQEVGRINSIIGRVEKGVALAR